MAAAAGRSKEAPDGVRCRRHPSHRRSAGVCPFCLCDLLSRLPSSETSVSASSRSSSASSPCSSGEESVASARTAPLPTCREARRARLGLLMRQEEKETEAAAGRHRQEAAAVPGEKKAKRSNFWARLQQGSWYKKDGSSLAQSKTAADKSAAATAAPKRALLLF